MNVTQLSRVTSRRMSRDGHAMSTTPHHTYIVTSVCGHRGSVQFQSNVSKGALGIGAAA